MAEGDDKREAGLTLEPMQAIGEALVRTFQNVADEKVPDHLLDLLDRLNAGEALAEFPVSKNSMGEADGGKPHRAPIRHR